jgi:nitrate/nitrite transporter NarK
MKSTRASEEASGFLRAGPFPTLVAALLYFDVSFMAWILLGPLAPFLHRAVVQRTGLYSYRAALVDADDESVA